MAADTRDPPPPSPSPPSSSPSSSTAPPESANLLPGGATNTAGGHRTHEATLLEAAKTVKLRELKEVHKRPCVRDALMVGIAGGFGVGGMRAILGATVWHTCTYAVATFCVSSAGMYEFCQRKRALELAGMRRAGEVMERKKVEKERRMEEGRRERRARREQEEERRRKEEERRSRSGGWKFW